MGLFRGVSYEGFLCVGRLHFRPKASPKRDRDEEDDESAAEDGSLSPRVGPVALEIESTALDSSDPCPMSSVVELDLNELMADQLFPSLADLPGPDPVDQAASTGDHDAALTRRKEAPPARTSEETPGVRRHVVTSAHSPLKRVHLVAVNSEADTTLSSLLSSPSKSKADADLLDRLQPSLDAAPANKQDWLKVNGPGKEWGDAESPSIGCSSFVLCDSSSGTSGTSLVKFSPRSSRSSDPCSPLKTMLISLPPSSASSSGASPVVVVNRNHVGQKAVESPATARSVKTSGGLIGLGGAGVGGVAGSAMRFHRPQAQQQAQQALSNGPLPAATAADCKLTTSLTQTI